MPVATFDSDALEVPTPGTTGDGWTSLKTLIRTLGRGDGTISRVKGCLAEFLQLTEIYEKFETRWDEYETMKQDLETTFQRLCENLVELTRLRMTGCMEALCRDMRVELACIRKFSLARQNDETQERVDNSAEILARYQRVQTLLQALLLNTDPRTCDIIEQDTSLGNLSTPPRTCNRAHTTGEDKCMRSAEVRRLQSWAQGSPSGAVCWVPETEQTGIGHSLCAELDATHKLGASFFSSPDNHDLGSIIPSIAHQLAGYSVPFRLALLDSRPQAASESLDVQFQELIANPLAKARAALPTGLVAVIDIMEEPGCVRPILDAILAKSKDLPIRFIIFSRPEPNYPAVDQLFVHKIVGDCVIQGVEGELTTALEPLGLSEQQLAELVRRAGVLFACAATAVRCINYDTTWTASPVLG